jgi:hypothetical protein
VLQTPFFLFLCLFLFEFRSQLMPDFRLHQRQRSIQTSRVKTDRETSRLSCSCPPSRKDKTLQNSGRTNKCRSGLHGIPCTDRDGARDALPSPSSQGMRNLLSEPFSRHTAKILNIHMCTLLLLSYKGRRRRHKGDPLFQVAATWSPGAMRKERGKAKRGLPQG